MSVKLQKGGVIIDGPEGFSLRDNFLKFLNNSSVINMITSSASAFIFHIRLLDDNSPYKQFNFMSYSSKNDSKIKNLLVKVQVCSNLKETLNISFPLPVKKNSNKIDTKMIPKNVENKKYFEEECKIQQEIFFKTAVSSMLNEKLDKIPINNSPIFDTELITNPSLDPATPGLVFYTNESNDLFNSAIINNEPLTLSLIHI